MILRNSSLVVWTEARGRFEDHKRLAQMTGLIIAPLRHDIPMGFSSAFICSDAANDAVSRSSLSSFV